MRKFDVQVKIGDSFTAALFICCAFGKINWWWLVVYVAIAFITGILSKTKSTIKAR